MSKFRPHTVLATLAACGVVAAAATPAVADDPPTGMRKVCVKSTYVFQEPGRGWNGHLDRGQRFRVRRYSPSGRWAYGRAFGNVNRNGWIKARAVNCKK
jgi:hypothetical protein